MGYPNKSFLAARLESLKLILGSDSCTKFIVPSLSNNQLVDIAHVFLLYTVIGFCTYLKIEIVMVFTDVLFILS